MAVVLKNSIEIIEKLIQARDTIDEQEKIELIDEVIEAIETAPEIEEVIKERKLWKNVVIYHGEYDVEKVWEKIEEFAREMELEIDDSDEAQKILETYQAEVVLKEKETGKKYMAIWKGKALHLESVPEE